MAKVHGDQTETRWNTQVYWISQWKCWLVPWPSISFATMNFMLLTIISLQDGTRTLPLHGLCILFKSIENLTLSTHPPHPFPMAPASSDSLTHTLVNSIYYNMQKFKMKIICFKRYRNIQSSIPQNNFPFRPMHCHFDWGVIILGWKHENKITILIQFKPYCKLPN